MIGVVGAIAAAAAIAYWSTRPAPVTVVAAETAVSVEVFGVGSIEAQVLSRVGFEAGGVLSELLADQGDMVLKGQVLARLRDDEHRARLAKADAAIRQAEASREKARAQLERARVVLAQKAQSNERRQTLVERGAVSREVAEDTQAAADIAKSDAQVSAADLAVSEAALADATSQKKLEQVLLDQHVLAAPFDARVIARHKELGVVANVGEAVFTLVDPATVWVRAYVDESVAGDLAVGQPATVRLRSLPDRVFQGEIIRIDLESDRVTEERRIYVRCKAHTEDLFLGEQAEVTVRKRVAERAIPVPLTMVEGYDGRSGTVWTVEDGKLARRSVDFADRLLDGRLLLRTELPTGVAVVASGERLVVGRPVQIR
ncbi:efflux RND transporter periplasmic adaptor subunit [Prosthecomicrobium sp. N25]|uniref:efflux RND transporter periplasmic adaptor subunit n=1 Tax=Prosthecomicrobium sp. N25 TaxID=3129254 RepID=UPI003077C059